MNPATKIGNIGIKNFSRNIELNFLLIAINLVNTESGNNGSTRPDIMPINNT